MDRKVLHYYSCGVIRRLFLLPLVAFCCASPLAAESVTVLVDASFSMSLPAGSSTRMETLAEKLYAWIDSQPPSTRYALLIAEHQDRVDLRLPYPARGTQVKSEIAGTVPWGAIDLGRAIQNAAQIAASIATANGESSARLVIMTDAEDMAAIMPARTVRLPAGLRYEVLRLDTTSPASVVDFVDGLQSLPDTEFATVGVSPPAATETRPDPVATAPRPIAPEASQIAPTGLIARWASIARWVFLVATLLGAVAVARAFARHRRRTDAVKQHNSRPPRVPIEVRGPSGRARGEITSFPAGLNEADLHLLHKDLETTDTSVRITYADGKLTLTAEDKVRINGIGRTEHELSDRDQVRVGTIRVVIGEVERVKPHRLPRASHRSYPIAPAAAAVVAVLGFVLAPSHPGLSTTAAAVSTDAAFPSTRSVSSPQSTTLSLSNSEQLLPVLRLPVVIGPDDPLPDFDADYLAIHAHPDDEALDFGGAIARMQASGLRGAVVLLTDGNAGLDQYPWREVGSDYPAHDLAGDALASVRIAESREAIGWLGAEYYIRLGLPNHPYGSLMEVLTPKELFDRWGGRNEVVERISNLIGTLRPEIILSPDGPAQTLEHFEHEATGLAVADAVAALGDAPRSPVRAHLIAVDPLQVDRYANPYRVSVWDRSSDGSAPRLRQLFALRAHRTQRDATVIGVETRLALRHEYYLVRNVDPGFDLKELFADATILRQ